MVECRESIGESKRRRRREKKRKSSYMVITIPKISKWCSDEVSIYAVRFAAGGRNDALHSHCR